MGVRPAPAEAEAVTVEVVGTGAVVLKPVGNVHVAIPNPQRPAPGVLAAESTVRLAVACFVVSVVPMKRFWVLLVKVPFGVPTGTLTLTLIVQELFAAMVPFKKVKEEAPATGVKVADPQPEVEYVAGVATTI